jgi:uncharacterized membrane protein YfhO
MDVFYQMVDALKDQRWTLSEKTSTKLSGTITAQQTGIMFTSIPYDGGWTVKVDGKVVEPVKIADALIGIELTAGEHTVEMQYCPQGFIPGLVLTCLCLVVFILLYRKQKHVKNG